MRHGPFRAYFATGLLSMMADNIEHVISYWVIFQAFHSPMLAGFAVISHWNLYVSNAEGQRTCVVDTKSHKSTSAPATASFPLQRAG